MPKHLRMPKIATDPRFDAIEPETALVFLNLYTLSGERDLDGRVPNPKQVAAIFDGGSFEFTPYYTESMWELEAVGLLSYVAGQGWSIPDWDAWNPGWDDPAARMRESRARKAEQLGLELPPASSVSPLNAEQSEGFGSIWFAYPSTRRGAKLECQREYRTINPDERMRGEMLDGLERFKRLDDDWLRGAIPQLRRFLHGRHWENAPVEESTDRTNLVRLVPNFGQLSRRDREQIEKDQAKAAMRQRLNVKQGEHDSG